MTDLFQGFELRPFAVTDVNNRDVVLSLEDNLAAIASDIQLLTDASEWVLFSDLSLLDKIDEYEGYSNPAVAGRTIGLKFPTGSRLDSWKKGRSRFEAMYQHRVVSEARAWNARIKACDGSYKGYVSSGWNRTKNDNAPTFSLFMNLGAVDKQYARIERFDNVIELTMIVAGQWRVFHFSLSSARYPDSYAISLPLIRVAKSSGRVIFQFSAKTKYNKGFISSRYIVGVDVGIKNYVTLSVYDRALDKSVHSESLSQRIHELYNKCKRTALNVKGNRKKGNLRKAKLARERNVKRKRELAILAAQEIAHIAAEWDNAVVVFEDLGWVVNTMSHGRWNRGELKRWTQHYANQNGSLVGSVDAARTSTHCSKCANKFQQIDWATMYCEHCDVIAHRDVDAATSVAKRFEKTLDKSLLTRSKSTTFTNTRIRRSPKRAKPGLPVIIKSRAKTKPTPKRKKTKKKVLLPRENRKANSPQTTVGGVFTCSVAPGAPTVWTDYPHLERGNVELRVRQQLLPLATT